MGRAITFPERCSRRLSAAVARKAKVKVLCVIQRKVFIFVCSRKVFSFLILLLSDCNLLFVNDLVNLVFKRLTTGRRVF